MEEEIEQSRNKVLYGKSNGPNGPTPVEDNHTNSDDVSTAAVVNS